MMELGRLGVGLGGNIEVIGFGGRGGRPGGSGSSSKLLFPRGFWARGGVGAFGLWGSLGRMCRETGCKHFCVYLISYVSYLLFYPRSGLYVIYYI